MVAGSPDPRRGPRFDRAPSSRRLAVRGGDAPGETVAPRSRGSAPIDAGASTQVARDEQSLSWSLRSQAAGKLRHRAPTRDAGQRLEEMRPFD
jgi:hypothetical protein